MKRQPDPDNAGGGSVMKNTSHKKIILFSILAATILILAGCSKNSAQTEKSSKHSSDNKRANEVIVYSYDSFVSEWGPGEQIKTLFEEKTGLTLTFVDCGDAVQVLSKAILEKKNVQADVILGIDNNIAQKAINEGILVSYKPKDADKIINTELKNLLCNDWSLTPYDYSHFALIYDTQASVPCPKSLDDLLKPEYAKKIILMDPRTSTPGLGFVAWTVAVYGDDVENYWKALKPNILTMTPGWSSGYGMFKRGEAPLVISYTTSPASHVEYDNTDRYIAAIFEGGHTMQVEGAGILKNAPNEKGAQKFIDFLISDEAQSTLPLTQWMNPINPNAELPESYKIAAPIPEKTLSAEPAQVERAVEKIMQVLEQ